MTNHKTINQIQATEKEHEDLVNETIANAEKNKQDLITEKKLALSNVNKDSLKDEINDLISQAENKINEANSEAKAELKEIKKLEKISDDKKSAVKKLFIDNLNS